MNSEYFQHADNWTFHRMKVLKEISGFWVKTWTWVTHRKPRLLLWTF